MMRQYTIVDYFGYNLSPKERMGAIKEAGFDGVILLWADYFDPDYKEFPKYARNAGLFVENTHAPYLHANAVWEDTLEGQEYTRHILQCIKDCADYGIPALVMHPVNGITPLPRTSHVGLDRFRRFVDCAEHYRINLAVENQGNPEYVDLVFRNIQSDRLGFCFDSGHEKYYSPRLDLLEMYGDKLKALHLHDNDGTEDAHALPFTGGVDWMRIGARLDEINYQGSIALETLNKGFEDIKDPVHFLQIALELAKKICKKREALPAVIARIRRMEDDFDAVTEMLNKEDPAAATNPEIKDKIRRLSDYCDGGMWLEDYERDERGELPADLKRGVLSQDGLYNLLYELRSRDLL